ncbi:hypothetical protein [Parapedobacter sp.]
MKSEKWYTKTLLDIPIWVLGLAALIYIGGTYFKNLLDYGEVDFLAIFYVSLGIMLVCLLTAAATRLCFHARHRWKGIVVLLGTVGGFPMLALAVADVVLPLFGIELQKEHVPFNWAEFMAKTFDAFFTVIMVTAVYALYYGKLLSDRRKHELKQAATNSEMELLEVKNNQLLNAGQSHYVKRVMTDVVARAVSAGDSYTEAQVTHIAKTFDYVAEATQDGEPIVSIHRALAYFNEVVNAIRLRNGADDRVVVVQMEGEPTMQEIGALTLTTLLENSDTHGWVDAEHPIRVGFVFERGTMQFTCTNAKNPYPRQVKSTGKGLGLVAQELALLHRHEVKLDVHESEENYIVSLNIAYS